MSVVEALIADGHKVTILAPSDGDDASLEDLGCRCIPLHMDVKGLNPIKDAGLFFRVRRILQSEKPDVVLSYTIKNNLFGALAAKSLGIPFIPNITGLGTAFLSGSVLQKVAEALYRVAFAKLPVVFFQNEDDAKLFASRRLVKSSQIQLLPGSGINLAKFAAAPPTDNGDAPVFLMIARLLRDKGVLEYVAAAQRVKDIYPNARFQLLGAISSENRTAIDKTTVAGWTENGWIEHLGTTDDVRPFIANADCVVLPSYREGAPRTLIEAAAMARPIIATDVPGCRSVIVPDETGLLCEVRDADSLASACLAFLDQSVEKRREMGRAGRAFMARAFDEKIVIAAYRAAIAQATKH